MRHLHGTARSPLALGRGGSGTVTFRPLTGGWWLWRPCPDCGGVEVPLRDQAGAVDRGCAECETRRQRPQPTGAEPTVWYDTLLEDWVVRLPRRDFAQCALMPLELRWYDADWADVYRAAADIVYGQS